jgi:hypothetical protein
MCGYLVTLRCLASHLKRKLRRVDADLPNLAIERNENVVNPHREVRQDLQASSCFQEPAFALTAGLIAARELAAG